MGELLLLEEIGFGSGAEGMLSRTFEPEEHGLIVVIAGKHGIIIDNEGKGLKLNIFTLSIAGRQLCSIIHAEPEIEKIVEIFKQKKPKSIKVGRVAGAPPDLYVTDLETKFEREGA